MHRFGYNTAFLVLSMCAVSACKPQAPVTTTVQTANDGKAPVALPAQRRAEGEIRARTVYVPAYSYLPMGEKHPPRMLSILLSVRNVDVSTPVTVRSVDYFDTSGHRVRRYLTQPLVLQPLETAEFEVATDDKAGGSGANFLVDWEAPTDAHPLLTEAIMVHRSGNGFLSFTSRGVELDERPDFPSTEKRPVRDGGTTAGTATEHAP